eukprot:CAMPEP_0176333654 /NCGR_PEP_ID=MMETSP0121_2-20121125/77697_1 /TAXON_ID=160619 /ORGANISM="Kryptoperidinium foliaceum, Strain CCMP 1326" /LENGTH=218 /DNA_ID=CAMNT_0017676577 /DNA_START=20 /DNA_END=673 /DNA_ORIENTATION=+
MTITAGWSAMPRQHVARLRTPRTTSGGRADYGKKKRRPRGAHKGAGRLTATVVVPLWRPEVSEGNTNKIKPPGSTRLTSLPDKPLSREDPHQEFIEVDGATPIVVESLEDTESNTIGHLDVQHRQEHFELVEAQLPVPILVQVPKHLHELLWGVAGARDPPPHLLQQEKPVSVLPHLAEGVADDSDRDRRVEAGEEDQPGCQHPAPQRHGRNVAVANR